jgi:sensor histidine kinase YesM
MNKKRIRILLHVLFWIVASAFLSWFFTRLTKEYPYTLALTGLILLIALGTTYFYNYFLIPRYLLQKKYLLFILLSLFTGLISLWMEMMGITFIYLNLLIHSDPTINGQQFLIDPVFLIAGLYFVIIAGVVIHLVRLSFVMQADKLKLENLTLEMQNKLRETELNSLKTQFHPHFLFNTLNNLYWLTLNKSEQAPQLVLKLSDLLDYSLHQNNKDRVSLDQEIDYLRNYLDIMKIRFEDSADIRLTVYGNTEGRTVAPLIFMAFVENACKHGLSQFTAGGWVHIDLRIETGQIHFSVKNNFRSDMDVLPSSHGLGLILVRSRLEHAYPDKHLLAIGQSDHEFTVELTLKD